MFFIQSKTLVAFHPNNKLSLLIVFFVLLNTRPFTVVLLIDLGLFNSFQKRLKHSELRSDDLDYLSQLEHIKK